MRPPSISSQRCAAQTPLGQTGRLLLYLVAAAICTNERLVGQTTDSLKITVDDPVRWSYIWPGISYTSIADLTPNIRPYDTCERESFEPGIVKLNGRPGATVLLTFAFPDTLSSWPQGTVALSFGDSSVGLVSSARRGVIAFFNPRDTVSAVLDSVGGCTICVAGGVTALDDVLDMDYLEGSGTISVRYLETPPGEPVSSAIRFGAQITELAGRMSVVPLSAPVRWSALKPGVRYTCRVDSSNHISPVDPEYSETIEPGVFEIQGSPGAQVLLSMAMPAKLSAAGVAGAIELRYDSLSAALVDLAIPNRLYRWFDPTDTTLVTLTSQGLTRVLVTGSPTASPEVPEGTILTGTCLIGVEYTGLSKKRAARRLACRAPPLWEIQFEAEIASSIALLQNHPNPFNPSTTIEYDLPYAAHVRLAVFDLLGREVALLVDEMLAQGTHTVHWDAGARPSGVYFYRLLAGRFQKTRKLVVLR